MSALPTISIHVLKWLYQCTVTHIHTHTHMHVAHQVIIMLSKVIIAHTMKAYGRVEV